MGATGRVRPARAAIEELAEWAAPVADELGVALTVPAENAAQRQIARYEAGETLEAIYAREILEPVGV